jgi:hypothetical protein
METNENANYSANKCALNCIQEAFSKGATKPLENGADYFLLLWVKISP